MDASASVVVSAANSPAELQRRASSGRLKWGWPLVMLHSRAVLFALVQAVVALCYALGGHAAAWDASIAWWPVSVVVTNMASFLLLRSLARREGLGYGDLVGFDRRHVGRDLLAVLGLLVLCGPVGFLPNLGMGTLLFGGMEQPLAMFMRPLPAGVAAACLVLFPLTMAIGELPTYYGYVMPRLAALTGRRWLAAALVAFWLAAQHATLPLIFDGRFIAWRLGMFLPFALLLAAALSWRPRLLPYLMAIHPLLDAPVAWEVFRLSQP